MQETKETTINFYTTTDDKNPYYAWFNALKDKKAKGDIDKRIVRV